jgi:hypothetical protein
MIQHYDQQLILEAQEYFSGLYGREITPDEAESFLKSLVNLYDSLSNKE